MHGILRPTQPSYLPLATGERRVSFAQQQQQQQQWPRATPESYYSSTASHAPPYQTPSQRTASPNSADTSAHMSQIYQAQVTPSYQSSAAQPATAYTNPAYPSTMAHSTPSSYPGYSPETNTYTYPGTASNSGTAPPAPTFESPVEDESDSQAQPRKRARTSNNIYGLKYNFSAPDIEALVEALGVDIQANAANPEPECTNTELSLDDTAMLPLLRPAIGPYSLGEEQDIPRDFEMTYPDPPSEDSQSQSQSHGESQTQPQPDSPSTKQTPSTEMPSQSPSQSQSQSQAQSQSQSQSQSNSRRAETDSLATAPRATVLSTLHVASYKSRSIVQRAASRGIIQAIENLDGFKYSFNNAWSAKDQDGYRFSYICQDSMQNKDRHANGFLRTQKFLKRNDSNGGQEERVRGPRKATYDCKGSVSVKFSAKVGKVVVQYRHCAIHGTVAERKPPPRKPSGALGLGGGIRAQANPRSEETKRRRMMGDVVQVFPPMEMAPRPPGREPSLFDLLCQSADADEAAVKKAGDVG